MLEEQSICSNSVKNFQALLHLITQRTVLHTLKFKTFNISTESRGPSV
jgi:hypothetical protein